MVREYDSTEPLILAGDDDSEITIKEAIHKICEISGFDGNVEVRYDMVVFVIHVNAEADDWGLFSSGIRPRRTDNFERRQTIRDSGLCYLISSLRLLRRVS